MLIETSYHESTEKKANRGERRVQSYYSPFMPSTSHSLLDATTVTTFWFKCYWNICTCLPRLYYFEYSFVSLGT